MAVSNGQRADQDTFNNAFLCKTAGGTVTGIVVLDNTGSGNQVANVQQAINDNIDDIASNLAQINVLFNTKQDLSEKDQPLGYAGLDANGRISTTALPLEAIVYRGVWDASTNTPTLVNGTGETGDVYRVSVAGNQDLGAGAEDYAVGDWVTYNGTIWERSDFVGAGVLNDLADIDLVTNPPVDGQALVYNGTTMMWEPGTVNSQENFAWIPQGTGSWDQASGDFVLDTDCYLSVPPLTFDRHTIAAQTISMPVNDTVAFITVDRSAAATTIRPVTVVDITTFVNDGDNIIIATRRNDELFVGIHDPQRFQDGDSFDLSKGGGGFTDVFAGSAREPYTPTLGGGVPGGGDFYWRRIGDSVHIQGQYIASGVGGVSNFTVSLPTGLVIDTAKYIGNNINTNGGGFFFDSGNAGLGISPELLTTTEIAFRRQDSNGGRVTGDMFVNNDRISFSCDFPIVGWEVTNAVGNAALTVETARTKVSGSTTAITTTFLPIVHPTVEFDTFSSYNTSTGEYTCPDDGDLEIKCFHAPNGASSSAVNTGISVQVFKNGTLENLISAFRVQEGGVTFAAIQTGSTIIKVNKDDIIDLRIARSPQITATTLNGLSAQNFVTYQMLPDFTTYGVVNPNSEYISAKVTSAPNTVTNDVFVDSDASITLPPGTWDLGHETDLFIEFVAGGVFVYANAAIRDAANNGIDGTYGTIGHQMNSGNPFHMGSTSKSTRVTITTATTYKLSYRASVSSGAAFVTLGRDLFTGGLTSPDTQSFIWARRIS